MKIMNTSKEGEIKAGTLIPADSFRFQYREQSSPSTSNLDLLTYGNYQISPKTRSSKLCHPEEEALLFCLGGNVKVTCGDREYIMTYYDTLYVPLNTPYNLENLSSEPVKLVVCQAKAEKDRKSVV